MNCPYLDCTCENIQRSESRCPNCRRYLKTCPKCSASNRGFAVWCRDCGAKIPDGDTHWTGFKGGVQRLGTAGFVMGKRAADIRTEDIGTFKLPDLCKSLLIYDHCVFAFSVGGEITVADISQTPAKPFISFHAGGNIYAVSAISQGSLYVGTEKYLQAYSLGNLFSEKPSAEPRWELPVTGTPVRELLVLDDRLYFMTVFPDRHHEISAVKDIRAARVRPPEKIFSGTHVSSLAGIHTDKIRKIYFLSQEQNGIRLHLIDHAKGKSPDPLPLPVKGTAGAFRKRIPIAVIGAKIFFVLKAEDTLCRLDAHTGEIDSTFCKNVREFSMAGINDPIISTSNGLLFHRINKTAELGEGEAIRGAPLILKDCAAAVGMRGGTVRLYDIHDPALPLIWSISENPEEPITALAASENILAAGNDKGLVKLCRLI